MSVCCMLCVLGVFYVCLKYFQAFVLAVVHATGDVFLGGKADPRILNMSKFRNLWFSYMFKLVACQQQVCLCAKLEMSRIRNEPN